MRGHAHPRALSDVPDSDARIYDGRLLRRLWPHVRPHRLLLLFSLLMLPLAAGLNLLQPLLVKLAIDNAIVPRQLPRLAPYVAMLIGALLLERLARYAEAMLLQLCGQRSMHTLRTEVHRHMLRLASRQFDTTPVGTLMTRVTNDIESITEAFSMGLISMVGDLIMLAGIVVVMLWLDPTMALLALAAVPVLWLVVTVFRRLIRVAQRVIRRCVAQINATAQEQIGGMSVVQIFGGERRAMERFEKANRAHRDAYLTAIRYDATLFALVELLSSLTIALLLWFGGFRVLQHTVTFGLLVAFIEYVQRFFIPIRDMSVQYMAMQQAMAASERVFDLLDNPDIDGGPPPRALLGGPPVRPVASSPGARHKVQFVDVSFAYLPGQPVLKQVSLEVDEGEVVAVVGATGSGKSTLMRLLSRLYELQQGAIFLDGEALSDIPLEQLRRRVVVVSQDVFLFAGSVADNISLRDPGITAEQIRAAAERVGLTRLLPTEREVLERGANLSAGERQLVAFARALVREPEVLVLDEATSSIDPEAERLIQEGTLELMRQRTSIVIAHRLSTIQRASRILVLHNGMVVEQGTHAELVAATGVYSRLYQLQYVNGA